MTIELSDDQLLRYSRHILLAQVDVAGQARICQSRVAIVGVGGLGSPVALYLAAAGVGKLVLIDDDLVELSNLQRQIIHSEAELGAAKAESGRRRIHQLNGAVEVETVMQRLGEDNIAASLNTADVVVDCCDNFTTRSLLNAYCWQAGVPLVSGAAIRLEGQLTVFDPRRQDSPCYRCLYEVEQEAALSCSESGVLGPMVGIIGAAQALEVLKILGQFGRSLVGRVQLFDAFNAQWREFTLKPDPDCAVCQPRA